MTWWPGWKWFVTPSGGSVKPGVLGFLDGIKRRPLVAHPGGAVLMVSGGFGVYTLFGVVGLVLYTSLLGEAVNQYYKAIRGVYGSVLWREVLWRMGLNALGASLITMLFF